MSDYDNNNRGVLFKNDKKGNDNAPDYKGNITVTAEMVGRQVDLAAWIKEAKSGMKFMSLSVSEPFVPQSQQDNNFTSAPAPQQAASDDFDDDIPFR